MFQRHSHTWKVTVIFTGMIVGILTVAFVVQDRLPGISPIPQPMTVRVSSAVETRTNEQLAKDAELIVLGRVLESPRSQWNTPSGTLPPGVTVLDASSDLWVYTDTSIQVDQFLKGTAQSNTVQVRTQGGSVPDAIMIDEDEATLREGQQVLLFLTRKYSFPGDIGTEHYWVAGAFQGALEVVDGEAVRRERRFPIAELLAVITRGQQYPSPQFHKVDQGGCNSTRPTCAELRERDIVIDDPKLLEGMEPAILTAFHTHYGDAR